MIRLRAVPLIGMCGLLYVFGCSAPVKNAPIERMAPERPGWLKQTDGQCERGLRCVVVQGEATDLSDARSAARAKGVSELVSEVAVGIRSKLSVRESQRYANGRVSESGGMLQTLEARVRGQLVGVRTLSVYWERRCAYTSEGTTLSYQAWLTVGVPVVTLTSLRDDAKQRTANYEADVKRLAQRLEAHSGNGTVWSSADAVRILEDTHGLMEQRERLIIDSPAGDNTLDGVVTRIKTGLSHVIRRRSTPGGSVVGLESRLTLFGASLAGIGYEVSDLTNGAIASKKGRLTPQGGLSLNLTDVRYLKPTTFVLRLLPSAHISLDVELVPALPSVPVEVELVALNARALGTLRARVEQRVLSAHPRLVRCSPKEARCFRIRVQIDLVTSKPKMAKMVYQSRGRVGVALDALPMVHLEPIERNVVGLGSSIRQSRRHLRGVVLDEIQKVTAKLLNSL